MFKRAMELPFKFERNILLLFKKQMDKKKLAIYVPSIIIICFAIYTLQKATHTFEMFHNYSLEAMSNGMVAETAAPMMNPELLLADSFPVRVRLLAENPMKKVTNKPFGSYKQITNNIRYKKSPDNEFPQYPEFSGAFYGHIQNKSNYAKLLPLAPLYNARRVNFYLSH